MSPLRPTAEEKERFLQYIRDGDDRATAAWRINPEYTGSLFKRMCNARSAKHYDAAFSAAYDEACEERGPLDPTRLQIWSETRESLPLTPNGYTKAGRLTETQLEYFLELVRDGIPKATAAKQLDPPTSITQIHRRAAKDADFAESLRLAMEEGYESYKDELRAEWHRQGFAGDYRALKDQILVHLEEARALMKNQVEISGLDGGAIRLLAEKHFSDLPVEMLDKIIEVLEKRELGNGDGNGDGPRQIGSGGG